MENIMKRYATLSTEFRNSRQSKDSIEKLYEFLDEISNATDKNSLLVQSQVYCLLGHHKKAYDIFVTIADKTNRKDASRLFEMEQMAQSHKDIFALKRKPAATPSVPDCNISDFIEEESPIPNEKTFVLPGKKLIFGKVFDKNPLFVQLEGNVSLENIFPELSDYIKWLGNCKNELIEHYNQNFDDKADDDWYNGLEIFSAKITFTEQQKLVADITCGDEIAQDHLLDVECEGKSVYSMHYDG